MTRTLSRRSSRAVEPEEDDYQTEEEAPRRGRRRGAEKVNDRFEEDDEPRRPRSSGRRSREEDDEPRRPAKTSGSTGRGWQSFKQKREERSDYVKTYKLPERAELIKILDDEPFSVYAEHWIDEITSGKRSFICIGEDCPLCDIGEKARVYALFNILDLSDPDNPTVFPWKVSQTVADVLETHAADKKTSPLNREDLYWSVYKSGGGKKGRVQTNLQAVKARDLAEDWDFDPPFTQEELDEFPRFAEDDVLYFSTRKELKDVADDLD